MLSPVLLSAGVFAVGVQALPNPVAQQKAEQGIVIPITKSADYLSRRAGEAVDLSWLTGSREGVRFKYGPSLPRSPSTNLPTRGVGQETLSAQSSLWMGPITIGGQSFQIDFDTGSSDLFVPSSSCTTGGCVGHQKYTPGSTATKKTGNFSIQYGDGSNSNGPIYTDNMSIAGISITNQAFSPVTKMSDSFAGPDFPADGLAGMGFQGLAHTYSPPFFQTMVSQGVVSQSIFSFRIAKTNSELFLGGQNPSYYTGALTYTPVTQSLYWRIGLSFIHVNNQPVPTLKSTDAIIDTGTTLAYGSYTDVAALWAAVPGSADMSPTYGAAWKGYYLFPCAQTVQMTLSFGGMGGREFQIPPSAMNLGRIEQGSSQCVGAMVGQDPQASGLGNTFLLGDAFLQGNYAVFDVGNARMGFAPLNDVPFTAQSSPPTASSASSALSSSARSSSVPATSSTISSIITSSSSSRPATSSSAITTSASSSSASPSAITSSKPATSSSAPASTSSAIATTSSSAIPSSVPGTTSITATSVSTSATGPRTKAGYPASSSSSSSTSSAQTSASASGTMQSCSLGYCLRV